MTCSKCLTFPFSVTHGEAAVHMTPKCQGSSKLLGNVSLCPPVAGGVTGLTGASSGKRSKAEGSFLFIDTLTYTWDLNAFPRWECGVALPARGIQTCPR